MDSAVDFNVMLGTSIQGYRLEASELLEEMDRLGMRSAVLVPVRPAGYDYHAASRHVAEVRDLHPDRFYAFGRVDARLESAAAEAERCLDAMKLEGIFVHPWEDAISIASEQFDPVANVCQRRGVPLLVASGYPMVSEALQVASLARRWPQLTIVMTNGGHINISGLGQRSAWLALESLDNLYITTSGVYRQDFLEEVVDKLGAGKLLFASQAPLFDLDFELHRVLWAHITEESRARVLGGNARKLLGRTRTAPK